MDVLEHRVAALLARADALSPAPLRARPPPPDSFITSMQVAALARGFKRSLRFARAPPDYYDRDLEYRAGVLGAPTVEHLCKTIVLVNTTCTEADCRDRRNAKYYMLVQQYTRRLNGEDVARLMRGVNAGRGIPRKNFDYRLADNAEELTGFERNAVTPIGSRMEIPVILSDAIVNSLPTGYPKRIWLGGGEVDLKWEVDVDEFVSVFDPIVGRVTF